MELNAGDDIPLAAWINAVICVACLEIGCVSGGSPEARRSPGGWVVG